MKLKMKEVEAKKRGTELLLEEMGVQRSEAEAQQVDRVRGGFSITSFWEHRDIVENVLDSREVGSASNLKP